MKNRIVFTGILIGVLSIFSCERKGDLPEADNYLQDKLLS